MTSEYMNSSFEPGMSHELMTMNSYDNTTIRNSWISASCLSIVVIVSATLLANKKKSASKLH